MRGFRLQQRSHLQTLKNFVSEKSEKHWIKSGNREILRRFCFKEKKKANFLPNHFVRKVFGTRYRVTTKSSQIIWQIVQKKVRSFCLN